MLWEIQGVFRQECKEGSCRSGGGFFTLHASPEGLAGSQQCVRQLSDPLCCFLFPGCVIYHTKPVENK